jgi:hypothetical protein
MTNLGLNIREAYKIDSMYRCFYVSEIIHNNFEYAIFGEITGFCYRGYIDEKSATDKVCSMNNPSLKNK